AYVVVPKEPTPAGRAELEAVAEEVLVEPMRWWSSRTSLPAWYRPLAWARGNVTSAFHARPVLRLARVIRERRIDLVYSNTSLVLDGALAARVTGRPHVWHVKEWVGRHARTRFPIPDRAVGRFMTRRAGDRVVAMTDFV